MLTSRTVLRSCLVAFALASPFAFVRAARADVTCGEHSCPQNYECKAEAVACPDIACAPNDPNCTPPDCSGTVDSCVALPCTTDSDCASGMVCYTSTEETCPTAPPCAKGQDCAQTDTTCTTTTVSACVPKYLLPCAADADCGAGFSCEEEQTCGCSASASSGSASSGSASGSAGANNPAQPADAGAPMDDAGSPPPEDCSCQPSGTKACNLKTVACNADTDCPSGFTCGANPNASCFADSSGNSGCTADPAKVCLPPYADLVASGHTKDGGTLTGSGLGSDTSSPIPPTNAPESSSDDSATSAPSSSTSGGGGGCSVAEEPSRLGTSFGFALLALAGLAGARRRRAR